MSKRWSQATGLLSLLLVLAGAGAAGAADSQASLYKRLGGYDAIAAVTDDFIGRLVADQQFTRFFSGISKDSAGKLRQHVVELLCFSTGGPCVYMGRDMKTAHAGLAISDADWDASVRHLTASLDKFKVGAQEKTELLALATTLKKDIVEKH
jgi:hemoglobin